VWVGSHEAVLEPVVGRVGHPGGRGHLGQR
jgi:hypothetical protein